MAILPKSSEDEREVRILEAAHDLFVRFGYDKTTVGEVAEAAGVSKGAIYLHFDSKDELFEAVMKRAIADYSERWMEQIEEDPQGGTIGGIYKNILGAMQGNPFVSAMLKRDKRLLGSYLHKKDSMVSRGNQTNHREDFVRMMQEAGAVREDADPEVVAHIMNIISYGLVGIKDVMEPEQIPPTDDVLTGIAEFMDRALTPEDGADSEAGKRILRQSVEAARQEMDDPSSQEE